MEQRRIRAATLYDDLAILRGAYTLGLNYDQVLVSDSGERIEGMLVLFDGGHQQIRVDHLQVLPDAPANTGAKLIEGLYGYCRAKGISEIVFCTPSTEFAVKSFLKGGVVSSPLFTVKFPVPKE